MKLTQLAIKMSPIFLLSACVNLTPSWEDNYRKTMISLVDKGTRAYERQSYMIKSDESIDDVVSMSDIAFYAASSMQRECEEVRPNHSMWMNCMDLSRTSLKLAAEMKITAAKYAVNRGNNDIAKTLYRDVITTFTGQAYSSYVRKAEFGLEDLNKK